MVDATREVEIEIPEAPQGVAQAVEMASTSTMSLPSGYIPSLSCSTDIEADDIGPPVALGIGVGRGRRIVALHILSLREKVRYDCKRATREPAAFPRAL